jgi:cyclopropane fatty-acyl-phospholipid synthase-like methyltransferase
MITYSACAHQNLEICSPLPWHVYENLLLESNISPQPKILDIGCGKAGILARVLEVTGGSGIGLDLPTSLASSLTTRAEDLCAQGRLNVVLEDAKTHLQNIDESFDVIICVGSSHALGGPQQVFEYARKFLKPRGKLLFGEIVWKSRPSREFLEFLDCSEQDQMTPAQLFELARECGLSIDRSATCSESDFDAYENELKSAINVWTKSNVAHPMSAQFVERSQVWTEAREKWARSSFGFEVFIASLS